MVRQLISITFLLSALLMPTVQAQAPAAERLDQLVERFMAWVDRTSPPDIEPFADPLLGDELRRLNPGREADVEQVVDESRECGSRIVAAMPRAGRNAARAMGEESLARLVEFLEGPAGEALARAGSQPDSEPLTEAQRDERRRLLETDPMEDFRRWMYSVPSHMEAADTANVTRCYEELMESATRLGLRTE